MWTCHAWSAFTERSTANDGKICRDDMFYEHAKFGSTDTRTLFFKHTRNHTHLYRYDARANLADWDYSMKLKDHASVRRAHIPAQAIPR